MSDLSNLVAMIASHRYMARHMARRFVLAVLALVVPLVSSCAESSGPTAPGPEDASARVRAHLVVTGSPESSAGATWSYRDTVAGVIYDLAGVLLKPAGSGPFPGVIVSHGFGGSATNYSRNVGTTIVKWGAVVIATNYTHSLTAAIGSPGTSSDLGASVANVQRARQVAEILRALGYVDMSRLAAHGHSMGAFVTTGLAATHPTLLRVASHTAGGVVPAGGVVAAPIEAQGSAIRTPYQMHHGDRDVVVALSADQRLATLLSAAGTTHELHVYPGAEHNDVAFDTVVLDRVRAWYQRLGLF